MIVVLSQGCAANFGDGEKIARLLSKKSEVTFTFPEPTNATKNAANFENAASPADCHTEKPEAFYLNVCTVKGNSGALKLLRKAASTYPNVPIYITGCAPKDFREEAIRAVPKVQFTTLSELEKEQQLGYDSGNAIQDRTRYKKSDENFARHRNVLRESPFVGIVNIEEGCLDACAFCSTHLVKGRLHSYAPNAIVDQVQSLVDDGCLEIQLTGQDCACYGFDIGTNLAELTQRILTHVNGNYRIRLGMGNPRHVLGYQEALLDCFTDERIYKFIHIPVQSGSENVLKAMNRRHTAQDYITLANEFNKRFSKFTLSTDLIVGYPGESAEDFNDTLNILKETRPTVCNITRFVARPNTVAARLEASAAAVPDNVKHERSAILAEAFQKIALENNSNWIGDECTVVTEKPGYRSGTTIARNMAYRPVALQGSFPAGTTLRVRITDAEPFALLAEPIA
ncbi:MiaB/RimO family radical SAM methylthiotransferase [Fibrobacter sp. UWB11]|uniref:MiaB/RimO family radical SAM methylthiotransferase n=1 Tax=Fibrobacter sp. UWB11 TaxID=1896202 RepID=UPI00092A12FD|nr:MiaB/RimO family radical SAM methylthiotransferase [Fibrobacter sp. UWB11]SIN90905.1 radical SAM methylthiotransferase, MiaB/RimO family [Fibrobacter sp. UWB11]